MCVRVQCDGMPGKESEFMDGERVASFLNGRMDSLGLSHLPSTLYNAHYLYFI